MTFDQYGATDVRIIKALERRIEALEAQVRQVPGAPVTQASGPLFLPNSSEPATPTGGVKMYAVGGSFRVIEDDGTVRQIPAQGAPAVFDTFDLGNAPAAYSQTYAQQQSVGISNLFSGHTSLLASLRNAEIIDT